MIVFKLALAGSALIVAFAVCLPFLLSFGKETTSKEEAE